MSKKLIQKPIIKVIQPAIYVRICDSCGRQFDKGERTRALFVSRKNVIQNYCRNTKCDPWRKEL